MRARGDARPPSPPLRRPPSPRTRRQLLPPPPPPPPAPRVGLAGPPRPRLSCAGAAVARAGGAAGDGEEEEVAAGIWEQVRDIVVFAGPALGLWICGPLVSLIDTMVIDQTSSFQLAALGPGTVFCDYLCYIFMFLSVATSNMVATSLAKKDEELAQHQVSMLLFVALACGIGMFLFTKVFGTQVLTAFTGSGNYEIISSANTYAQIRGFTWPAVLVGLVAQSASLGMKDSWGPLKALAAASIINGVGDIFLCSVCGYGIAGAAWATMVSQFQALPDLLKCQATLSIIKDGSTYVQCLFQHGCSNSRIHGTQDVEKCQENGFKALYGPAVLRWPSTEETLFDQPIDSLLTYDGNSC
ncbi:protein DETOXIFICATION 46, chloroplastic-like [Phragmites australis]|uniref:protein DETOXIFICATION 46, chloroplastic-like n=1 Tax=Phragmites australis TaxID=29695 RepID=UPI002D7723C7|nr:protein DETOXIFICATION 46, chloroplastic-like [Phragmites australis]